MDEPVRYEMRGQAARITLTAPETGNALGPGLLARLHEVIGSAAQDETCRAIVLSAEGPEFSRGMDFDMVLEAPERLVTEAATRFVEVLSAMCASPLPIVACVEGRVSGGGLGLIGAADLVIGSREATFMAPEVIVGMIPAMVAPFALRRISPGRLRYMALSSRAVTVEEAATWGLVDEIAEEDMDQTLNRQLKRIFKSSPEAIAACKVYFDELCHSELDCRLDKGREAMQAWVSRPETLVELRRFASGLTPSWFGKRK